MLEHLRINNERRPLGSSTFILAISTKCRHVLSRSLLATRHSVGPSHLRMTLGCPNIAGHAVSLRQHLPLTSFASKTRPGNFFRPYHELDAKLTLLPSHYNYLFRASKAFDEPSTRQYRVTTWRRFETLKKVVEKWHFEAFYGVMQQRATPKGYAPTRHLLSVPECNHISSAYALEVPILSRDACPRHSHLLCGAASNGSFGI